MALFGTKRVAATCAKEHLLLRPLGWGVGLGDSFRLHYSAVLEEESSKSLWKGKLNIQGIFGGTNPCTVFL